MAVDTLFDGVRVLVQGASTANAAQSQSEGWAVSANGVAPDAGTLSFSGLESFVRADSPDGLSWTVLGGTVEAVVEMRAPWASGGSVLYIQGADVRVHATGYLSIPGNSSSTTRDAIYVGTGRIYVSATLRRGTADTATYVDYVFAPEFGTRVSATRQAVSGISAAVTSVIVGATPTGGYGVAPSAADFQVSLAHTQVGADGVNRKATAAFRLCQSVTWARLPNPDAAGNTTASFTLQSGSWVTVRVTPTSASGAVGAPISYTLSNAAGLTPESALSTALAGLASSIPGASAYLGGASGPSFNGSTWSWYRQYTLELPCSDSAATWAADVSANQVFGAQFYMYDGAAPPGQTMVLAQPYRIVDTGDVTVGGTPRYANVVAGTYLPAQRTIYTATITKNGTGRYGVYMWLQNEQFIPADDLTVDGAFQTAVAAMYAGTYTVYGAAPQAGQLILTLVSVENTQLAIYAYNNWLAKTQAVTNNGVSKLHGLRVSESYRAQPAPYGNSDPQIFPELPWPTTSIPSYVGGGLTAYRYYHITGFELPTNYGQLWLSELQLWENSMVRANGVAWHGTVGTNQGYAPGDGVLEDGDLTSASTSAWSTDFVSYPGLGLNTDFSINYDLGTAKTVTGFKYAKPSTDPGLAGVSFDIFGSNDSSEWGYGPNSQTTWTLLKRVSVANDPSPEVLSGFIEFQQIPPSTVDVEAAGYNNIAAITGDGTFNLQDTYPPAYFSANVTLGDATSSGNTFSVDGNTTNFSGTSMLVDAVSAGTFIAGTPVTFSSSATLDSLAASADFYAGVPLQWSGDSALDDAGQLAMYLFMAPAEFTGNSSLNDAMSGMALYSLIEPLVWRVNAGVPAATLVANATQFLVNAQVPAVTLRASMSEYRGFELDAQVPAASLSAWAGLGVSGQVPMATLSASGTVVNTLRLDADLPRVTLAADASLGQLLSMSATVPAPTLSAWAGAGVRGTVPAATGAANVISGGAFRVDATVPAATAAIGATSMNVLRLVGDVPSVARANWLAISRQVPTIGMLAHIAPVSAVTRVAYSFTLANSAMTRYPAYPFIQVIRMGNTFYGVAEDGLHEIGGTTDNAAPIPWSWETCLSDFGQAERKTVVSAYLGGYVPEAMTYTIRAGDVPTGTNAHATTATAVLRNHRQKFGIGRKSRYFAFGLSAAQGRVAIESIEFEVAPMSRRI